MLPVIFGVSLIKSMRPYIKRNVFDNISSAEFIFLNSIFIAVLSFCYAYIYKGENMGNIWNLTYIHYMSGLFLACVTVVSSLAIFKLQEDSIITPIFIIKSLSAVILLVIGIFIYNERLNAKQIAGIFMCILAIFLIKG
jgi:drug/metabolite transporter (DMT)-like permease